MAQDNEGFLNLLREFESLPTILKSKSIFDITGYPHYENVCSRILAFYLDPNNEHGLGGLLFSSLMLAAKINPCYDKERFEIKREKTTYAGGRIDIVIETDNQIIGIENKIYHRLINDLDDYSNSIEKWAEPNQTVVKIVLSIREESASAGFICVTYKEFLEKIREQLGKYISTSSQKWVLYLVDFMNTIDNLSGKNMKLDENDQFFIDNEERVNTLLEARKVFVSKLNDKVKQMKSFMEEADDAEKYPRPWIWKESCLVFDFNLSGHSISFDLKISARGWELQLFGRDDNSRLHLDKLMREYKDKIERNDSRYILQKYELTDELNEIELNEIREGLHKWFDLLLESDRKLG